MIPAALGALAGSALGTWLIRFNDRRRLRSLEGRVKSLESKTEWWDG